jgi:hypothetical protein
MYSFCDDFDWSVCVFAVDCRTDLKNGVISLPSSSDSSTTRYLVPIPLVSSHDLFKCIYNLAPWYRKVIFMVLSLCLGPLRAFQKVLYPVFCQSMTLEIFYWFLVSEKHSQQKICDVLKTCATPSNYPLVFHCTVRRLCFSFICSYSDCFIFL